MDHCVKYLHMTIILYVNNNVNNDTRIFGDFLYKYLQMIIILYVNNNANNDTRIFLGLALLFS